MVGTAGSKALTLHYVVNIFHNMPSAQKFCFSVRVKEMSLYGNHLYQRLVRNLTHLFIHPFLLIHSFNIYSVFALCHLSLSCLFSEDSKSSPWPGAKAAALQLLPVPTPTPCAWIFSSACQNSNSSEMTDFSLVSFNR